MARPTDIGTEAPAGEGTRVKAFARIEREEAESSTDPKVMAMTRARPDERTGEMARTAARDMAHARQS